MPGPARLHTETDELTSPSCQSLIHLDAWGTVLAVEMESRTTQSSSSDGTHIPGKADGRETNQYTACQGVKCCEETKQRKVTAEGTLSHQQPYRACI